jgi:hypothetical protein
MMKQNEDVWKGMDIPHRRKTPAQATPTSKSFASYAMFQAMTSTIATTPADFFLNIRQIKSQKVILRTQRVPPLKQEKPLRVLDEPRLQR